MNRLRFTTLGLLAAWSLMSGRARADVAADAAALKQFEDAVKFYEQGQVERALLAFQGSLSLLPSPNTRLYIARCYRALGKTASAHTNYRLSAREASDRVASGEKRFAATRDAAISEAAEFSAKVPRVTLAVSAPPPAGLSIAVDGVHVPAGAWGSELEFDPGQHRVLASAQRHDDLEIELSLAEGARKRVEIVLKPRPTALLQLDFQTRPSGLSVLFDQRPLEAGSGQAAEVAPGAHSLEVSAPGYRPFRWNGSLTDGERRRVSVALELQPNVSGGPRGTPPWVFFSALGVSAAALGTGSYFALHAESSSDAQRALDPLRRDPAVKDDIARESLLANLSFGVGALAVVGTGVLCFTTTWQREKPRQARLFAMAGTDGATVLAGGRF